MLTKLSYLIDNPWSNALDRARQAGAVLADILLNRRLGVRPVSLIGYSLGARVVFFALLELAKQNAFGVVQEVYLFGATVTASIKVWRQVRGVVAGRFVNGFAMNDWILGYLFRATTGGLQTVAGLRPIEHVPDLENVDITHILDGHMSYRTKMPKLLAHVGFKVTADHFDEPDFDPQAPDREVLTEEEIERRRVEKEKRERGALGIFRRKKKDLAEPSSQPLSRTASTEEYDQPARLSSTSGASSLNSSRNASRLSISSIPSTDGSSERRSADLVMPGDGTLTSRDQVHEKADIPAASPREAPVPSGFDLDKLRQEVAQLPRPSPPRAASVPPIETPEPSVLASTHYGDNEDLQRPPSAPPPLEPPRTDLRELDQGLDPRELLRRQWNGDTVPPSTSEAPALGMSSSSAWDSSANLPDDQYAAGFSFPSPGSPPLSDVPTFTFGNGTLSSTVSTKRQAAADPSDVWASEDTSSPADLGSHNPW